MTISHNIDRLTDEVIKDVSGVGYRLMITEGRCVFMTSKNAYQLISEMQNIFDVVRLVDAENTEVCHINPDGSMEREPLKCFEVWKKDQRCVNCISTKICAERPRIEKYEFVDDGIYHVTSKQVEVDGVLYALEIVSKTTDETLFEAYGKEEFIHTIEDMNHKLYVDELTGVYNRRYYDEQVSHWQAVTGMAVIDIDSFKRVNDTFGHLAGDEVLKAVAGILRSSVRAKDAVIRYGGDEFVLVFIDMPQNAFEERLEQARVAVEQLKIPDHPQLKVSVSIGGTYIASNRQAMFALADEKLYKAKKSKNKVIIG